jgi:predicted MPP superfamily phosphohydrolase
MVQVIHISDFHLDTNPISLKKEQLVEALIDDLKKQNIDTKNCIIVVSGDLIDKGGCSFTNTKAAFDYFKEVFFDKIKQELLISNDQFFFVPGNHDVNRNKVDQIIENGTLSSVSTIDNINDFITNNRENSKYLDRLEDYKLFEKEFYQDSQLKKQLSNFDSCFITSSNIGIACLNSSWRSSKENEEGRLIVGEKQIELAKVFLKNTDVKIAVMHHPFEDLLKEDKDKVKSILFKHFDILLIGHKHQLDIEYTKNFHGTLLKCQSNASVADFSDDQYTNGYSIINFNKGGETKICYRKYLSSHEKFVANTDIGSDSDDGCMTIPYPNDNQIAKTRIVDKALYTLENVRFDNVNEHLFTYGLDTNVPCKINELFVEPVLSNIPETHSNPDDIIYYHLSDFIRNSDNFLIYGLKESGKTTLLNKLMVEFTRLYQYNGDYIPVYFEFSELGNKRISQVIRDFLSISSEECRNLLSQNRIVLLVDDITFDDKEKLNKIIEFVQESPNNRIIAAKEQILENTLPTDFWDYNDTFNFNVVYIQNFKAKQIKRLIKKWFPNQSDNYKKRINSIIKNFEALSLPRTPLAVTLFLWIIDKQEKTPINNSLLVQQVVENLLEKTHFENVYQNKFNFQNKIRLLAFIAKKMEDMGDEEFSYRMKYSDLLDYIEEYLKGKITLSPKIVVGDFVKRGVLTFNQEDFVKFKFDFLYRYFLSLYINIDDNFKVKLFNSKECLNYFDEIVYYSGLHTDDRFLLDLSQEVLLSVFSEYNKDIVSNWEKIDSFLNTRKSLSSKLSMGKIQKKPTEKELEKIYDEELNNIPIKRSIERRNCTDEKPIDKTLKFASLIFRNLEDIDDQIIRAKSLQNIITSSISLMLIYRDSIVYHYIKNNVKPKGFPKNIDFGVFIRLLPLLHQVLMSDWIGTEKTKLVIKDKIDKHNLNTGLSEYEKFLDIFVYADIKGSGSLNIIKDFLIKNKYRYIKDLGAIKLILYYYMRSKTKDSDLQYLNLISDLKRQLKQIEDKGKYIQQLSDARSKNDREVNKDE